MAFAGLLSRIAAELALFAGVGFLLFGVNDLVVDIIYFARRLWRSATIYRRHRRAYASYYVFNPQPGFMAILVPAWDEATVIAPMLRATLDRLDYEDYRIFVGYYRNDPATAAAIASVPDPRVVPVEVPADGPTTGPDSIETWTGRRASNPSVSTVAPTIGRLGSLWDGTVPTWSVVSWPSRRTRSSTVSPGWCRRIASISSVAVPVR